MTATSRPAPGPHAPGAADDGVRRGQLKLLALAALFIGPVIVAFVMYYGLDGAGVGGDVSRGELVLPTEPMPSLAALPLLADGRVVTDEPLRRYWNIVHVTGDGCGATCAQAIADTRKVRGLLVKEIDRIGRVLVLADGATPDLEALRREHPDLAVVDARGAAGAEALARLGWDGTEGLLHVTDPRTNVVTRYPPELDRMELFHDLKRLLKLSRIG